MGKKSPECRRAGKDKHNSAKPKSVTCLLTHPQEQRCEGPALQLNTCGIIYLQPGTGLAEPANRSRGKNNIRKTPGLYVTGGWGR